MNCDIVTDHNAKTIRTASRDRSLSAGTYWLSVSRHVAAMVDGEVLDWADGRLHRLRAVWRLTAARPKFDRTPITEQQELDL